MRGGRENGEEKVGMEEEGSTGDYAFHYTPFVPQALFWVKISLNVLRKLLPVANATKGQVRKS